MSQLARREGFVGQHLVVLPDAIRSRARAHELLRGLHVTDAGYFPAAAHHLVERPHGAPTTLVILCLRGAGWCKTDLAERTVAAGDLFWLPAGLPHAYGAGPDPWTIAWVHFGGQEVPGWRSFLHTCAGSDDDFFRVPRYHLDKIGLDRVYPELEHGLAVRFQIAAAASLRSALSNLGQILVECRGPRTARDRVVASVESLKSDWLRAHKLEDLATAAGMSVTHYCAHFRALTGFAPIDYLIRMRIRHSCHLLDTSKLTIAQVAGAAGYNDPYYFARCFRRVMGCSPRQYRNVPKG